MKRFLSMVLALALVLTTLMIPVAAEDGAGEDTPEAPVVETVAADITSIANGETFAAGSNIGLAVDATGLENVAHIDFYANDDKLPGTVAGNKGSIAWYDVAAGVYTISTKVTDTDGNVKDGNETLRITVLDSDWFVPLWPGKGTLSSTGGGATRVYTDEFAMFDSGSNAVWKITPNTGGYTHVTFTPDEPIERTWEYLAFIVYADDDFETVTVTSGSSSRENAYRSTGQMMVNNSNFRNLLDNSDGAIKKGFNRYVAKSATYTGGSSTGNEANYLENAQMHFTKPSAEEADLGKSYYIVGVVGIKAKNETAGTGYDQDTDLKADAEILSGTENVSKAVGTYRINFSGPIYQDVTKVPAEVTDAAGNPVTLTNWTYGTDYVELELPELADDTTYTVTIPEDRILSYYSTGRKRVEYVNSEGVTVPYTDTNTYVEASTFTFTTAADAKPVIAMSYPADGATVAANTAFAAKVVANGAADIESVKLYNGDAEIATGTEMADGEYWFTPEAALTAGAATVLTVKAVDASGNEVTASATYTGATAPSYYVKGIYDGANIVVDRDDQASFTKAVTVVDSANAAYASTGATSVSKVAVYKDGALVDTLETAPYTYNMAFDSYGEHKLDLVVTDTLGGVHTFANTYKFVDAAVNPATVSENFDSITAADAKSKLGITIGGKGLLDIQSKNGSNALIVTTDGSNNGTLTTPRVNATAKVQRYSFKVAATKSDYRSTFSLTDGATDVAAFSIHKNDKLTANDKIFPADNEANVREIVIEVDQNTTPMATVYVGGKEFKKVSLAGMGTVYLKVSANKNTSTGPIIIDDYSYTAYDAYPEYAVKGIKDGEVMIKQHEAERTITVEETINGAVSDGATITKVELLRDGKVVATSTTNTCVLPNNLHGEFELEVKVTDIYGDAHSFTYNYRVLDATKDTENSIDEDFNDFPTTATSAELAAAIAGGNGVNISSRLTLSIAELNGSPALKIDGDGANKTVYMQFGGDVSGKEHKLYYYEFDVNMTASMRRKFYIGGNGYTDGDKMVELFTNKNTSGTNHVKIVVDYNAVAPVATVYVNKAERAKVSLANVVTTGEDGKAKSPVLTMDFQTSTSGAPVYIDNFKYSVYNAPARFGKGSGATDITFDTTPSSYNKVTFTTSYTNTTDEAVGVRYFFACYEEDGRMAHLYKPNHDNVKVKPTGFVWYYEPGAVDKKVDFQVNVAKSTNATSAKVFAYVIDDEGNIDFSPIGWY